ncbi:MAG: PD-(D/E)XK nuclease family transposase [Bacilli bacterium]|nr:PD-(D/E)XK nuclease family transposase [Bacilli bacterium]
MVKLLDPKNDIVFQKLFGMKKNRHILISFLNSILNLTGENSIKDAEFEEKHLYVSLIASEKLRILDLHVTTETGVNINVEIQLINQYNIKNYALFEKETKLLLTNLLEIVFIEIPKFNRLREWHEHIGSNKEYNEKLHKWLTFLSNPMGKETEEFMKNDGEIKEAMDVLYKISGDKKAVMLAEMREKAIMDEQSRLKGAREEGLIEGLKEGLDKGRKDGLKETIIDNLREHGNVPQNLIDIINNQDDIDVLKSWTKIAVISESIEEFSEKIK